MPTNSPTPQKLVLIDGHGLIFRAFHAVQTNMRTSAGELTNAVFGFTTMLMEVLRREAPTHIIMTFDTGRTFRHDLSADYKANRSEMPDDLRPQVDRIKQVVTALGISTYEAEGYEADDVIGTLAVQGAAKDLDVLIVTGDNDLLQLVAPHVRAVTPSSGPGGFSQTKYYDSAADVETKYGFQPERIPDYKALYGDKSDNILGVPGVGEKTATDLIQRYGTVEDIYAHLDEITKPKALADKLREFRDQCFQGKQLATIVTSVPDIHLDLDAALLHHIERERVRELFRDLEFRSMASKLDTLFQTLLPQEQAKNVPSDTMEHREALPVKAKAAPAGQMSLFDSPTPAPPAPVVEEQAIAAPSGDYRSVTTADELARVVARVRETQKMAFDTETTSTNPIEAEIVGISIAPAPGESYYIPLRHVGASQLGVEEVAEALRPIFTDLAFDVSAHHAQYDLTMLNKIGLDMFDVNLCLDSMIAAYLLNKHRIGLKDLASFELRQEMTHIEELIGTGKSQVTFDKVPVDKAIAYAAADADMTLQLAAKLLDEMRERDRKQADDGDPSADLRAESSRRLRAPFQDGNAPKAPAMLKQAGDYGPMEWLAREMEQPLVPVLATMERAGIALDVGRLKTISIELAGKMKELEGQIYGEAGHEFNINSTDQLGKVLYDELGLTVGKKTSTKKPSTDKKVLDQLREEHPIVDQVLEWRQLAKLKSTYVDSLPQLVNPQTGRIHTSFKQTQTATGRISSIDPNLQNIPIRTDVGRTVRRAFVAGGTDKARLFDEESVLFGADYSQIELRLLADLSGDPLMNAAFQEGRDVHAATAADIFGVELADVTGDMRRVAKTANFGIIYGLSAHGLAENIGMARKDASDFIKRYYERYPRIREYLEGTLGEARKRGYVETRFGRRRYLPDLNASNHIARQEAERQAINAPVQGSAADIIKLAMIRIASEMRARGMHSRLLLQVHDELVFEVPRSEITDLAALVKSAMEGVITLKVPLKADLKVGTNWGDTEEYK